MARMAVRAAVLVMCALVTFVSGCSTGERVDLGDGAWFNLRASNTEPLLRLNVEARTRDEVDAIVDEVLAVVRA